MGLDAQYHEVCAEEAKDTLGKIAAILFRAGIRENTDNGFYFTQAGLVRVMEKLVKDYVAAPNGPEGMQHDTDELVQD